MMTIFAAHNSVLCLFYLAVACMFASRNMPCGASNHSVSKCISSSGIDMTIPDSGEKLYDITETPHGQIPWRSECTQCPLHFDHQYCIVNNTEDRECLVKRAYLETEKSCLVSRNGTRYRNGYETFDCVYVEFCIFSTEEKFTSCNYNCSVDGFDTVNCKHNMAGENYTTNCTRSLVHCPKDMNCAFESPKYINDLFRSIFLDDGQCALEYRHLFDLGKPLYYINLALDDCNKGFGALNVLNRQHETCVNLSNSPSAMPVEESSKYIAIGVIAGLAVILVIFSSLVKYMQQKREFERLKKSVDVYVGTLIKDRPDSPTAALVYREPDSILSYMTNSLRISSERNNRLNSESYVSLRTDTPNLNTIKHDSEENQYSEGRNLDETCSISIVTSYTSSSLPGKMFPNYSYSTSETILDYNLLNEWQELIPGNRKLEIQNGGESNIDDSHKQMEEIDPARSHDDVFSTSVPGNNDSSSNNLVPLLPGDNNFNDISYVGREEIDFGRTPDDNFGPFGAVNDNSSSDASSLSNTGNDFSPSRRVRDFIEKNSVLLGNGRNFNVPRISNEDEMDTRAISGLTKKTESESQEPSDLHNGNDHEEACISLEYPFYVNFKCDS